MGKKNVLHVAGCGYTTLVCGITWRLMITGWPNVCLSLASRSATGGMSPLPTSVTDTSTPLVVTPETWNGAVPSHSVTVVLAIYWLLVVWTRIKAGNDKQNGDDERPGQYTADSFLADLPPDICRGIFLEAHKAVHRHTGHEDGKEVGEKQQERPSRLDDVPVRQGYPHHAQGRYERNGDGDPGEGIGDLFPPDRECTGCTGGEGDDQVKEARRDPGKDLGGNEGRRLNRFGTKNDRSDERS